MSKEAMKLALETSEGIVNADWRKWDELASPSEFERWAKSRANFMATILREALAEQPAQPYQGIADHINQATNGRMRIDPVTGNVGIGTPSTPAQQQPVAWQWKNTMNFRKTPPPGAEPGVWRPVYTSSQPSKPCEWQREDDVHMPDTWRSDCGVMWTFTDGGPVDNDMKYCCGCGAKLVEKKS